MAIKRFGVSLEASTLDTLDELVEKNNLPNRSRAIRFLIEKYAIEKKWECNNEVAGAIVLVYDHHKKDMNNRLLEIQHEFHNLILAVQHVHLNHDNCLETITVKGKAVELTALADKLIGIKGIRHGKLVMTST